jgi:hypothetical protein
MIPAFVVHRERSTRMDTHFNGVVQWKISGLTWCSCVEEGVVAWKKVPRTVSPRISVGVAAWQFQPDPNGFAGQNNQLTGITEEFSLLENGCRFVANRCRYKENSVAPRKFGVDLRADQCRSVETKV